MRARWGYLIPFIFFYWLGCLAALGLAMVTMPGAKADDETLRRLARDADTYPSSLEIQERLLNDAAREGKSGRYISYRLRAITLASAQGQPEKVAEHLDQILKDTAHQEKWSDEMIQILRGIGVEKRSLKVDTNLVVAETGLHPDTLHLHHQISQMVKRRLNLGDSYLYFNRTGTRSLFEFFKSRMLKQKMDDWNCRLALYYNGVLGSSGESLQGFARTPRNDFHEVGAILFRGQRLALKGSNNINYPKFDLLSPTEFRDRIRDDSLLSVGFQYPDHEDFWARALADLKMYFSMDDLEKYPAKERSHPLLARSIIREKFLKKGIVLDKSKLEIDLEEKKAKRAKKRTLRDLPPDIQALLDGSELSKHDKIDPAVLDEKNREAKEKEGPKNEETRSRKKRGESGEGPEGRSRGIR